MRKRWIVGTFAIVGGLLAVLVLSVIILRKPKDLRPESVAVPQPGAAPAPQSFPRSSPPKYRRHEHGSAPGRSPASIPPSPPTDEQTLEEAVGHLRNGNLAYNTPEKMKTGQTAHVIARIASDKVTINTLEEGMAAEPGTKTATASTSVSTKMKMTLKSADFDITALSSEEQFVAGDTPTTWEWDIAPKHSGKLRLHLAAVVELNNISKDYTTVDRDIAVQVDPVDAATMFAKANGVWILTTLGAGIAGLWTWLRKRKKPTPPSWATP